MIISFLGSLPLGTLNITTFHIAASQSIEEAILFAIAVVLVELVVVRITLTAGHKIDFSNKLFSYVLPMAIILLMYLGVSSFISSSSYRVLEAGSNSFPMIKSSILLGVVLSILNPMHFPFWITWNNVLVKRKILDKTLGIYTSYIAGIGLGSFVSLIIFVLIGIYASQNFHQCQFIISFIMGCVYMGFSIYLISIFYKNHLKYKSFKNV